MPRKPQPSEPTRWDIYRAAAKARWIGTVEATNVNAAIEAATKELNVKDPKKLIAVSADSSACAMVASRSHRPASSIVARAP
jgi:hypothetical protein